MFAVVVLAGGAARRVGGATKPALPIGGRPLLGRVLDAVAQARPRIVIGPPELALLLPPDVTLTREDPPGGGPVAAIAAGLFQLDDLGIGLHTDSQLAVLAGDLPFLSPAVLDALRAAQSEPTQDGTVPDGAVLTDDGGRPQWLTGVWRLGSLRDRLAVLGDPSGRAVRDLVAGLRVAHVAPAGQEPPPWFDCDTEEDLRRAERLTHGDTG